MEFHDTFEKVKRPFWDMIYADDARIVSLMLQILTAMMTVIVEVFAY